MGCVRRLGRAAALLLVFFAAARSDAATAIWIDTDPSFGAPYREVDDAFALVLAFHSRERRIAGISTTYGNAGVRRTTTVARDLVRRFGAPAALAERDVHEGSAGPGELRQRTRATDALAAALRRERLTYVALGPLTNLATFLELHPELASRLDRVIFVGGQTPGRPLVFGPGGRLKIHDANAFKDPTAVRLVLQSKLPLVLAPPETGGELILTRADAREMTGDGPAARFLQRGSGVWLWFWSSIVKHGGGPLFDPLGTLAALDDDSVRMEKRYAKVTSAGELLAAKEPVHGGRRVTFCTGIGEAAKREMMSRLLRDCRHSPAH